MQEIQLMCYKRGHLPGSRQATDTDVYEYCSIAENEPKWAERHQVVQAWLDNYGEFYDIVIQHTHDEDYHV